MLHGDGLNNDTIIIDETSSLTPTITGSVTTHTDVAAYGSSSIYFNSGKLTYPASSKWYLGDTFTIEAHLTPTSFPLSSNQTRILMIGVNNTSSAFVMQLNNDGSLGFGVPYPVTNIQAPAGTVTLNERHHYAISVSSSVANIFKDGVKVAGPVTITPQTSSSSNTLIIGYDTVGTVAGQYTGYIDDFRITKGVGRYPSNFTVSTQAFGDYRTADYYWENTVLLMHMEGTNTGTTFTDQKGHTITNGGICSTSSDTARQGITSGRFLQSTASILKSPASNDWSFGSGDFTIEVSVNFTNLLSTNQAARFVSCGSMADGANNLWTVGAFNNGTSHYFAIQQYNGSTYVGNYITYPVAAYTWYDLAIVKSGTNILFYVNDILMATQASALSSVVNGGAAGLIIGARYSATATDIIETFYGYIDELRITKGVSRYSGRYSKYTTQFPDYSTYDPYFAYNVLLMHMDGTNNGHVFTDITGKVPTVNGNVVTSTTKIAQGISSMYLPGVAYTDNIAFAASNDFALGNNSFTIEMFSYMTAYNSNGGRMVCASGGGLVGWNSTNGIHWLVQSISNGYQFEYWNGTALGNVNFAASLNTWNHIAVSYDGTTLRVFLNGVSVYSGVVTIASPSSTPILAVGAIPGEIDNTVAYTGYIDELRITKGAARYLGNFIPPQQSFQDQ